MGWTKSFVPKAAARQSTGTPWAVFGTGAKGLQQATPGMIPNADLLRKWSDKMPFLSGGKNLRRSQATGAEWDILPIDPDDNFSKPKRKAIIKLLENPNVKGRNTDLGGLLAPVVDDMITLANGVIVPEFTLGGQVGALNYEDGQRVRHALGWRSDKDGPRYGLLDDNGRTLTPYLNRELIVFVMQEQTWNPYGVSPVSVIFQQLLAWEDTFMSVYAMQKNRAPAGILNLGGMPEDEMRKLKSYYDEIEGNSTIALLNHPLDQFKFEQIGSIELNKMGTPWWIDLLVRCVAVVLGISPINLMWTQDVNRATSKSQLSITGDQGIEPLMRQLAAQINREVVATFGDPNLRFVWKELLVKDQMDAANTLKSLGGERIFPVTINDQRRIAGLKPYTLEDFGGDKNKYAYVSEPLIWTKNAMMPISALAQIPDVQPADVQQANALAQARANATGQSTIAGPSSDAAAQQEDEDQN